MTKEQLAALLNNREYTQEITNQENALAKANRLLVVYGASDDLCELRGAIEDEAGVYTGGTVVIADGKILPEIDDDDIEILKKYGVLGTARKIYESSLNIEALWCKEEEYSWTFKTDAPHASFEVIEDGEKYCRGIVIDLKELESLKGQS
jgi:hypothetical protein